MTTKKTAAPKKKTGRPTLYTEALAKKICGLIEEGVSERKICEMTGMPTPATLRKWKDNNPSFLSQSVRARAASAARFREEALQVAREASELADKIANRDLADPTIIPDLPKGYVEAKKLLVQELNREAAIRDDSRFGDRKKVALTGENGGPIKTEGTLKVELTPKQREILDKVLDDEY